VTKVQSEIGMFNSNVVSVMLTGNRQERLNVKRERCSDDDGDDDDVGGGGNSDDDDFDDDDDDSDNDGDDKGESAVKRNGFKHPNLNIQRTQNGWPRTTTKTRFRLSKSLKGSSLIKPLTYSYEVCRWYNNVEFICDIY